MDRADRDDNTQQRDDGTEYNQAYIRAKQQQAGAPHDANRAHSDATRVGGDAPRLPPGQILTTKFPILDLGVRPSRARYPSWTLEVRGKVAHPFTLSLPEIKAMAALDVTADFHCVTRWSKYDVHWKGIPFENIVEKARPRADAQFVTFHAFDGYTTNVERVELMKPHVIVACELEGEEIPPEHGGPIRMIIPHLYGWKSAKFLTAIEFMDHDLPGFWETRGYSNKARPWMEERYG